mmetsp:Transcript_30182/g.32893  ORF Transcript_30182/g.32893 Transcript_30182/m.32893 type:complete len:132 (+) Transcript_30182:39-434(+)
MMSSSLIIITTFFHTTPHPHSYYYNLLLLLETPLALYLKLRFHLSLRYCVEGIASLNIPEMDVVFPPFILPSTCLTDDPPDNDFPSAVVSTEPESLPVAAAEAVEEKRRRYSYPLRSAIFPSRQVTQMPKA